ncbi:MAG: SDR family oxidoreductase [Myxococcales bacterium]|nr:SDR family oxidoreductase [Myxococcales bacterium]
MLPGELAALVDLLESLVEERTLLADAPPDLRHRLLVAAGRVSRPSREEQRALRRAMDRRDRQETRAADTLARDATGIRAARRAPIFSAPPALPEAERPTPGTLRETAKCYVCKAEFREVHSFYDQMCIPCGEFNLQKRHQTSDLRGRYAVVTGARVKIGYHAGLKLLRAGCHVIVTTRFPRDAAGRYASEPDYPEFHDRLEVHGLDLRHTPSVEAFADELAGRLPRLDYLVNNACQTVRRPPGFYRHLVEAEAHAALPGGKLSGPALPPAMLLPGDQADDVRLFPIGKLDADLQQVDLRSHNSWRLTLAEVPTIELLEVQLVNAIAPFVLAARLKPRMLATPNPDKHVVNVSAMEGQFYRTFKTDRHPHTNMAKAALNMLTRTSAADYEKDGIHMNSVDTGWITDEDPHEVAERKVAVHGFSPPLDVVDGAARILAPIFDGELTGEHVHGLFLKDYKPCAW